MDRVMEIKIPFLSLVFITLLNFSGCTPSEDGCLTRDKLTEIRILKINNTDYYLYLKISGWHDKVVFYELYDKKPVLDACNKANILPIADIVVSPENGTASKLIIKDKQLFLNYTKEKTKELLENIFIELK